MKAFCPLSKFKNELCEYGGSKKFDLITAKLSRCYCKKINEFVHDLKVCPIIQDYHLHTQYYEEN